MRAVTIGPGPYTAFFYVNSGEARTYICTIEEVGGGGGREGGGEGGGKGGERGARTYLKFIK